MSTTTIPPPISYPPTQPVQITSSSNIINSDKITTGRYIWGIFKIVYSEVIQILTLAILWFVAFRQGSPPTWFDYYTLLFPIVCQMVFAFHKCYKHWPGTVVQRASTFSTTLQLVDRMSSETPIVKVTGYRLLCTVLPLGLAIAKYALSAGDNSVGSNNLDFVGYVVGGIVLVWIGFYPESHETFAPWFFRDDYSQLLFRGLGEFVAFCVAGVIGTLFIAVAAIGDGFNDDMSIFTESRQDAFNAWIIVFSATFIIVEGGLLLGIRSAKQPKKEVMAECLFRFVFVTMVLLISLRIWRELDPQSLDHFLTLYERIGVKKLLFRTVVYKTIEGEAMAD